MTNIDNILNAPCWVNIVFFFVCFCFVFLRWTEGELNAQRGVKFGHEPRFYGQHFHSRIDRTPPLRTHFASGSFPLPRRQVHLWRGKYGTVSRACFIIIACVTALIIDRWYLNFFTEILLTIFSFSLIFSFLLIPRLSQISMMVSKDADKKMNRRKMSPWNYIRLSAPSFADL